MHPQVSEPQDSSTVQDPRQRRQILVATCLALMAVVASASGLNVAQRELATTFGASQSTVLWFINVYIVALAATLMPIGAIGDRQALIDGWRRSMWISVAVMGLLFVYVLLRGLRTKAMSATESGLNELTEPKAD